jgi:hypothetical protein
MNESNDFRKSAKDAHKRANQAAESSRLHSNDLGQMVRSAKGARERLADGQDRQLKGEQVPPPATARPNSSLKTARIRLQAIESQLNSAFNYCSTAENAMSVLGRVESARRAIENARHTAEKVRAHIKEPRHVPANSVAGISERLAELEGRISSIEMQFGQVDTKT